MKSTSTTTIYSTKSNNTLLFIKEKSGLTFNNASFYGFQIGEKFKKDEPNLIDLISDQPKVLVSLTTSLYHLYNDNIGEFLAQYEVTPNAKFLIDITHIADIDPLPEYIKMFFKFLNKKNIDYRPINLAKFNKININNFYFTDGNSESFAINQPSKRLYDFSQQYIVDKDLPATKKVYLSRKNFQGRDLSFFIKGRLPYENDNRIDNEELVQEYFRGLGFEIVIPEDFQTFEEQMNYFYQVKTIVSATSSGLVNACFMRPGSTMIELSTPLISFERLGDGVLTPASIGQEEIHHFYHTISIMKNHKYISIPNLSREAKEIINTIEGDELLKAFIQG